MDITNIILDNENLIYKCASYFKGQNIEDLYQAGCLGMIKAYKNYKPNKHTKFTTYAYHYIMGEMKLLAYNNKPYKVNKEVYNLRKKIMEAKESLTQVLYYEPTNKQLAKYLEIDEQLIDNALSMPKATYLDEVKQDNILLHEIISTKEADINDLIYLKNEIEKLEEPEKSIIIGKYLKGMSQEEIGKILNMSQVEVSRKQHKTLKKMKVDN